jgi:hypothetical protein
LDSLFEIRLFPTPQQGSHKRKLNLICGMSDLRPRRDTALSQYRFRLREIVNGKEILNLMGEQVRSQPARRTCLDQLLCRP